MRSRLRVCWLVIATGLLCPLVACAAPALTDVAFTDPRSPVVNEGGQVTLIDGGSYEIVQLDRNGSVVRRFGGRGDDAGLLQNPYVARFSHWGGLMILDYNGISLFSADGRFLERWKPQGLTSWSDRICDLDRFGRLYMPMRQRGTVECAEGMGKPRVVLSQETLAASMIRDPAWVHVDREGSLYVQDAAWGAPIVIYDASGRKQMVLRPPPDAPAALASVCGIARSQVGHFLICSDTAKAILDYDVNGRFVRTINIPKDFRFPTGFTADGSGNLYVGLRMVARVDGVDTGDIMVMDPDGNVLAELTGSTVPLRPAGWNRSSPRQ